MMNVELLPALQDNYIFVISNGGDAIVIDPGSADPVLEYLSKTNRRLKKVLVTHHHYDHTDGILTLIQNTQAEVYGPASLKNKNIPVTREIQDGDEIEFGPFRFKALALPGHTLDQICYFEPEEKVLFSGDTLFSMGCGRLFEGTYEQMFASLERIKSLPPTTRIYAGHEYTLRNLQFSVDYLKAHNADTKELRRYLGLLEQVAVVRQQNQPTLPSRLDFELKYNLFLRAKDLTEFQQVRRARDQF